MIIKEITLQAANMGPLYNFYREVMELPVFLPADKTLLIQAGESALIFKPAINSAPFYHIAFGVFPEIFDHLLKKMGQIIPILWLKDYNGMVAKFTNWGARSFYFYDPAGNILEIICRPGKERFPPFQNHFQEIFNISELGIVFSLPTFPEDAREFLGQFSLELYNRQPPFPNFIVAGDDEGLFIMVPENRNWYPAPDKKSAIFPIMVCFEHKGLQYKWRGSGSF